MAKRTSIFGFLLLLTFFVTDAAISSHGEGRKLLQDFDLSSLMGGADNSGLKSLAEGYLASSPPIGEGDVEGIKSLAEGYLASSPPIEEGDVEGIKSLAQGYLASSPPMGEGDLDGVKSLAEGYLGSSSPKEEDVASPAPSPEGEGDDDILAPSPTEEVKVSTIAPSPKAPSPREGLVGSPMSHREEQVSSVALSPERGYGYTSARYVDGPAPSPSE